MQCSKIGPNMNQTPKNSTDKKSYGSSQCRATISSRRLAARSAEFASIRESVPVSGSPKCTFDLFCVDCSDLNVKKGQQTIAII